MCLQQEPAWQYHKEATGDRAFGHTGTNKRAEKRNSTMLSDASHRGLQSSLSATGEWSGHKPLWDCIVHTDSITTTGLFCPCQQTYLGAVGGHGILCLEICYHMSELHIVVSWDRLHSSLLHKHGWVSSQRHGFSHQNQSTWKVPIYTAYKHTSQIVHMTNMLLH